MSSALAEGLALGMYIEEGEIGGLDYKEVGKICSECDGTGEMPEEND